MRSIFVEKNVPEKLPTRKYLFLLLLYISECPFMYFMGFFDLYFMNMVGIVDMLIL